MQYFLGVDAGATKTTGALADEERELARAETGSIKTLRTQSPEAYQNLQLLFTRLTEGRPVALKDITRTCIGISGYTVPTVANWVKQTVPTLAGGELLVCGDDEIALDGAFQGGPGVLIIAGTGSNVIGRTRDGRTAHAGGWGPVLGDEGSGHWIGLEALRGAFRAHDARRPTILLDAILRHWRLTHKEELVEMANTTLGPDFSKLTHVIHACAEQGDAVSIEVLTRAGSELGHLAISVIHQMRAMGETSQPSIAFIGSVLAHIDFVRDSMAETVRREIPTIEILLQPADAVQGALWRARSRVP